MDALLNSNRLPEPHEATFISAMINAERDSMNTLDTRIHKLKQDAKMARHRIQQLTTQLEAETRSLRLYEDAILELRTPRNALRQSIKKKQTIMSSRRRIPGEVWRMIFLLLWESEYQYMRKTCRPVAVALQVGAVCHEWRNIAQRTTKLWSILDYTFGSKKEVQLRRDTKLYHYLDHIGSATPYITLRRALSLRLPTTLCHVSTAAGLSIQLKHLDLQPGRQLTFPLSTPLFSHLRSLFIDSYEHVNQLMSDSLHPFPSLNCLHLTNMEIHRIQNTIPHTSLMSISIGGTRGVPHPWASTTIDITLVAEWFPNLTHLKLDCDLRISAQQVVLHLVESLCIRSSAITDIQGLTSHVSFPNLTMFTNWGKSIKGLVPLVQAWGERVKTLELSGVMPYHGSNQHLKEILGHNGTLPRLSRLVFLDTIQTGMIDLALVTEVLVRRKELAANDPGRLKPVEIITLPTTYKSDSNLERLKHHVTVQWK